MAAEKALQKLGESILAQVNEEDKSFIMEFFDYKDRFREILKGLLQEFVTGTNSLKIGEDIWNPCQYTLETRENMDWYVGLPLAYVENIFPKKLREYIQAGRELNKSLTCFENPQLFYLYWSFAYLSGIYNELIDEVGSVGQLGQLGIQLTELEEWLIELILEEETQEEFLALTESIQDIEVEDANIFYELISGETQKTIDYYTNTQQGALYRIAEKEGRLATFIASFFIGLGEVKTVVSGSKALNVGQDVLQGGQKVITEGSEKITKLLQESKDEAGTTFLKFEKKLKEGDKKPELSISDQNGNPLARLREDGKLEVTNKNLKIREDKVEEGVNALVPRASGELLDGRMKFELVKGVTGIVLDTETPNKPIQPDPEEEEEEEEEEETPSCEVCQNRPQEICELFDKVYEKGKQYTHKKNGINAICNALSDNNTLIAIANRLLRDDISPELLGEFLSDVQVVDNDNDLGNNLGILNATVIDAWYAMSNSNHNRLNKDYLTTLSNYIQKPYTELVNKGETYEFKLDKLKRSIEQAKEQSSDKGIRNFMNNNPELILKEVPTRQSHYLFTKPNFDLLYALDTFLVNNPMVLVKVNVNGDTVKHVEYQITLDETGFGYSGIMSPDGRVAYQITARTGEINLHPDDRVKVIKGSTKKFNSKEIQKYIADFLKSFAQKIQIRELDKLQIIPTRNAPHRATEKHAFGILEDDIHNTLLWGFSLNLKPNTKIVEVGFVSGESNRNRSNGREKSTKKPPPRLGRLQAILNRTDQKKLMEYLKNATYLGQYKNNLELKDKIDDD